MTYRQIPNKMTVASFLDWAKAQPGRYELHNGEVLSLTSERVRHAATRAECWLALRLALDRKALPHQIFMGGIGVQIGADRWFQPDILVRQGPALPPDAIQVPDPVIIVEVVSPATQALDAGPKLAAYAQLKSLKHYLLAMPDSRTLVHHRRQRDGSFLTSILGETGRLDLDPPGIAVDVRACFPKP